MTEWTDRGMHSDHPSHSGPLRVGIVGAGRVGTALARALRDAGVDVDGPVGRGERPSRCDAIVLCVPDAEIAAAAETVTAAAPLVGHTSGATPLTALAHAGVPGFGLHPLQSFAHPGVRFEGAGAAVAGTTPEALEFAVRLAERLGMTPFEIDDEGRAAYHAAASVASNFLVTLQAAAEAIAAGAPRWRKCLAQLAHRPDGPHVRASRLASDCVCRTSSSNRSRSSGAASSRARR